MPAQIRTTSLAVSAVREDLCLAYANTLAWRGSAAPVEQLADMGALVAWLSEAEGLGGAALTKLAARLRRRPVESAALFDDAIALREAIYRVFAALAAGGRVSDADLAALNRALAAAPPRDRLMRIANGYGWRVDRLAASAPALLAPVLWSAADLLVRRDVACIRQCANEQCLWLFLDMSKGGTRRWCDMASCGNRAKARRHYLRSKRG
ncbi:MAG: CGNR zinc finger domain-containing protein [Candidatus Eiseniibacteriota bacterium]